VPLHSHPLPVPQKQYGAAALYETGAGGNEQLSELTGLSIILR
jgi:hypothetical protein